MAWFRKTLHLHLNRSRASPLPINLVPNPNPNRKNRKKEGGATEVAPPFFVLSPIFSHSVPLPRHVSGFVPGCCYKRKECGLSQCRSRLDADGQPVFLPGQLAKVTLDLDAVPELV